MEHAWGGLSLGVPDEYVLHDKRADTLSSTTHNIEGRIQLSFSCLTLRSVVENVARGDFPESR